VRSTITALQMGIRAVWLVQLALGLAFWTGNVLGLVDLHQLIGILLVLALWTPSWPPGLASSRAWWPWPPCGAWS
jgi:hypothetical protein